jgi:hypothetical protein
MRSQEILVEPTMRNYAYRKKLIRNKEKATHTMDFSLVLSWLMEIARLIFYWSSIMFSLSKVEDFLNIKVEIECFVDE